MTGLEKVTDRIAEEAKDEASKLIDAALEKIKQINADADEKIRIIEENKEQELAAEGESIISRAKATAEMQNRSIILESKYKALDELFDAAESFICSQPSEDYLSFIMQHSSAAVKSSGALSCILSFNEKDKEQYGKSVVSGLSGLYPSVKFSLSSVCAKISGGVLLDFGETDVDCSVKAVLAEYRPSLEGELCKLLFESAKTK